MPESHRAGRNLLLRRRPCRFPARRRVPVFAKATTRERAREAPAFARGYGEPGKRMVMVSVVVSQIDFGIRIAEFGMGSRLRRGYGAANGAAGAKFEARNPKQVQILGMTE
jgi:hypothetical protein